MDPCTTEIYTLSLHDALPIWRRGKRESVENVLHGKDQILPSVELIGHRRGVHATAGVQVPQGFARHRIKSEQIAGVIGSEEKMPGSRKNPRDAFSLSNFVIPHDFAATVVNRTQR